MNMVEKNNKIKLFSTGGFVPAKEYVDTVDVANISGPWRFPIGVGDKVHLFILRWFTRISWFSDMLYILYPHKISPAYYSLVNYLRAKSFVDHVKEHNLPIKGYYCFSCTKYLVINNKTEVLKGEGVASSRDVALSKAIGEVLERTISGVCDENKNIVVKTFEEISKTYKTVYPPKFHRLSGDQKEHNKEMMQSQKNKAIVWVKGHNVVTKEVTYIPKTLTSYVPANRGKADMVVSSTSNGAAGYFNKSGAILRGVLEVVERDAFLVHWLTKTSPQVFLEETLPFNLRQKVEEFGNLGFRLFVLNTTALQIPSVCVVAINYSATTPKVVVTASSALDIGIAIEKAVEEMMKMVTFSFETSSEPITGGEQSESLDILLLQKSTRQKYWTGIDKVREFEWFLSGEKISYEKALVYSLPGNSSEETELNFCLDILKKQGEGYCPVVYYPKNSIQEKVGFYVVQVYIPKAFPLYLVERFATFDSDRLKEFAESKNNKKWTLNTQPHMFS